MAREAYLVSSLRVYYPVRKASLIYSLCQALGSLTFAPKHHMINPLTHPNPSLEPPPDVAGGDTGGVSVEEM